MEGTEDKVEGFTLKDLVHFLHEGPVGVDFGLNAIEHLDPEGFTFAPGGVDPFPVEWQLVFTHPGALVIEARVTHGDVAGDCDATDPSLGGALDVIDRLSDGVPAEGSVHVGIERDDSR